MLGGLIYGYGSGGILRVTLCAGLMRQGCNEVQRCVRILPKRLERRVGCGRAAKLLQAIDCCLAGSLFPGGHASAGTPACVIRVLEKLMGCSGRAAKFEPGSQRIPHANYLHLDWHRFYCYLAGSLTNHETIEQRDCSCMFMSCSGAISFSFTFCTPVAQQCSTASSASHDSEQNRVTLPE